MDNDSSPIWFGDIKDHFVCFFWRENTWLVTQIWKHGYTVETLPLDIWLQTSIARFS